MHFKKRIIATAPVLAMQSQVRKGPPKGHRHHPHPPPHPPPRGRKPMPPWARGGAPPPPQYKKNGSTKVRRFKGGYGVGGTRDELHMTSVGEGKGNVA